MKLKTYGKGSVIVLIHGFCENSEIWADLISELSSSHHIITIDLPGFGDSPLTRDEFTIDDVAQEVKIQLSQLDVAKCFMIGHSLGGYVALSFASLFPDLLNGFGLFHSTTSADSEEKKILRIKTIEHVRKNGIGSFAKNFVPNLFYSGNHQKFGIEIDQLRKMAEKTSIETFECYSLAMKNREDKNYIFEDFLKPIFIIAGKHDNAVPLDQSSKMIATIKKGDHLLLSKSGHMGFIEEKDSCFEFIKSFLKNFSI